MAVPRLVGIDVARGVAFCGMLLAHYVNPYRPSDPGWHVAIANSTSGRAAPLFCMILGLGAGLMLARGTRDRVLVRRGIALLALGLALWPRIKRVFLILPHYGVLLLAMPLLRRIPRRWLLPVALVAFAVPSVIAAHVDRHGMRRGPEPRSYGDLRDVWTIVEQLVWSGGYPLVGWLGFVLLGLWLGGLRLDTRRVQLTMLVAGGAVAALQPLAAAVFNGRDVAHAAPDAVGWVAFFDGAAHSNRFAWYVLASGTAACVLGACLLLARRVGVVVRPFAALGAMALSVYLAHLWVGTVFVWPWRDDEQPPIASQLWVSAITIVALVVFALVWRRWFRRGPVETVLRWVAR